MLHELLVSLLSIIAMDSGQLHSEPKRQKYVPYEVSESRRLSDVDLPSYTLYFQP